MGQFALLYIQTATYILDTDKLFCYQMRFPQFQLLHRHPRHALQAGGDCSGVGTTTPVVNLHLLNGCSKGSKQDQKVTRGIVIPRDNPGRGNNALLLLLCARHSMCVVMLHL